MSSNKFASHTLGNYKETDKSILKQESVAYFLSDFTTTEFVNLSSLTNCYQIWKYILTRCSVFFNITPLQEKAENDNFIYIDI